MCFNPKDLSYKYYTLEENVISRQEDIFENQDLLEINLTLEDVLDGEWNVKEYRMLRGATVFLRRGRKWDRRMTCPRKIFVI